MKLIIIALSVFCVRCQESNKRTFVFSSSFQEIVKSKYYVDKTLFLKTFLENQHGTNNFVTAPRNFGKSLNLLMMKHFLEIQVHENGKEIMDKTKTRNVELFIDTKIYKEHPEFFKRHFGQYPVIFIDYGSLSEAGTFGEMLQAMRSVLLNTYNEHSYLLLLDHSRDQHLKMTTFKKYIDPVLNLRLDMEDVIRGFLFLTDFLHSHFQRQPIILIDEYDAFVNSILFKNNGDVNQIIQLIQNIHRPLIEKSFQTEQKLYCTGVLPIASAILSPVDRNLTDYSFLDDHPYSQYNGLTEPELTELLERYTTSTGRMKRLKQDICDYYGGYVVLANEVKVCNILSVLRYLYNKELGERNALVSYWDKPKYFTSFLHLFYSSDIIGQAVLLQVDSIRMRKYPHFSKHHILTLKAMINDNVKRELLYCSTIFHFLLQHGYVMIVENLQVNNTDIQMSILEQPNSETYDEIRIMMYKSVLQQFKFDASTMKRINNIIDYVSKSNCEEIVFKRLSKNFKILFEQSTYNPKTESVFQKHMFSLLVSKFEVDTLPAKVIKSKRKRLYTGLKFYNKNKILFIIELKLLKRNIEIDKKQMKNCANDVLNQIIAKRYNTIIEERVVCLSICLGVYNFKGQTIKQVGLGYAKSLEHKGHITYFRDL